MKRSHIFEADDGTTFETAAACKAHEERQLLREMLCGRLADEIDLALDRTNIDLADAIERAGNIIAAKRRESGELRRKAKTPEKKP